MGSPAQHVSMHVSSTRRCRRPCSRPSGRLAAPPQSGPGELISCPRPGITLRAVATVGSPSRLAVGEPPASQLFDRLAVAVLVVAAGVALMTFRDYGLGWDDYTHSE